MPPKNITRIIIKRIRNIIKPTEGDRAERNTLRKPGVKTDPKPSMKPKPGIQTGVLQSIGSSK